MTLLQRLGLDRPELRAWALYDWANSAFITTVITTVFPTFYQGVAAQGLEGATATSRYAFATTAALVVVAVIAPVLGSLADHAPIKKKLLAVFLCMGVITTAGMSFIGHGDWVLALILFGIANIGVAGSFVFYDSLLPHIASQQEMDRVSTAGYALGYLGGGLLLLLNLAMIQKPAWFGLTSTTDAVHWSFISVAVWWLLFSLPLFRSVPEPAVRGAGKNGVSSLGLVTRSFTGLWHTLKELRRFRHAWLFLVAFLLYNDGIQTIIRMAAIFGTEIGLEQSTLIGAILMVQFVGIPFAFAFGQLAGKIGAKRAVYVGIFAYMGVSVFAYTLTAAWQFWVLAALVGMVQGGTQALSRSLFAQMIPKDRSSEMFGLFAVFEKFAGIFGPLLFGIAVTVTASSRAAILSVIVFFIVGALLLSRVDVEAGRRAAREADSAASG